MAKIKYKKSKAKRAAKKASRRRRHGPTSWNKFVKNHAGKGHSMHTLGVMYRKAGHGKKAAKKPGRRKARRSGSQSSSSLKHELVRDLLMLGISLKDAKERANAEILKLAGSSLSPNVETVERMKEKILARAKKAQDAKDAAQDKTDRAALAARRKKAEAAAKKREEDAKKLDRETREISNAKKALTRERQRLDALDISVA